jgi:hypothetical protein
VRFAFHNKTPATIKAVIIIAVRPRILYFASLYL